MSKRSHGCIALLVVSVFPFLVACDQKRDAEAVSKRMCRDAVALTGMDMNFELSKNVARASVAACKNARAINEGDNEIERMLNLALKKQSYYLNLEEIKILAQKNQFTLAKDKLEKSREITSKEDHDYLARYIASLETDFKMNSEGPIPWRIKYKWNGKWHQDDCQETDLATDWEEAASWADDSSGWIDLISTKKYDRKIVYTYFDRVLEKEMIRTFYKNLRLCENDA